MNNRTRGKIDPLNKSVRSPVGIKSLTAISENRKSAYYLLGTALVQTSYFVYCLLFKGVFAGSILLSLVITLALFTLLPKGNESPKTLLFVKSPLSKGTLALVTGLGLFLAFMLSESLNARSAFLSQVPRPFFHYLKSLLVALIVLMGISALCYAVFNKAGVSMAFTATLLLLFSLINHYMLIFRDRSLLPHDFYGAQTALNVLKEYHFIFAPVVLASLQILVCFWIYAVAVAPALEPKTHKPSFKIRLTALAFGALTLMAILSTAFWSVLGLIPQSWSPNEASTTNTFMLNFLATIPYSRIVAPREYEQAKALLEKEYPSQNLLAANAQQLPDKVIVVMNEAFTDFSIVKGFETNVDPLAFWHQLSKDDKVIQGNLIVNAFGGGTALSEFEALTGTLGTLSEGINEGVMQRLVHRPVAGLPQSMKALGYKTIAMHPYTRSGWGRPTAYPHMGFDQYLSLETMPFGKEDMVRSYVSDQAFYEYMVKVIDPIQEPVFLFAVTMQNHGGYTWEDQVYNTGQLPVEDQVDILSPQGHFPQAQQYLNLLYTSDRAYEWLINHYSQSKEKVAIVLFGDHWPAMTDGFEEALKDTIAKEDYAFINHTVPYMIWSNYPLEAPGVKTDLLSVNYLSPLIKEALSIPFTGFDNYLLNLANCYPVLSAQGAIDQEGNAIKREDMDSLPLVDDYKVFQYNNLTGKKGYMKNLYLSAE